MSIESTVNFVSDGLGLTPAEFAQVLQDSVAEQSPGIDSYSLGGAVEALEAKFAELLGKERALFLPTGTMANHMALRQLAGLRRRVLVPADSHIYRDIGDAATTLSGLNMIPLAPGRPTFTLDEVQATIDSWGDERVDTQLGAIAIESLLRRHDDVLFDGEEMKAITDFARERGIPTHMDGARLFVEAVHRGVTPAQQAAMFDTVFVSVSKCFNCASGAILAGPADVIEGAYHTRRMLGGSLPQAWPQATVGLHYADTFLDDYTATWSAAQKLFEALGSHDAFGVEYLPQGTHIVPLHVSGIDASQFCERLSGSGVRLPAPESDEAVIKLKVNPSILRRSVDDLARSFVEAARKNP